MLVDFSGSQTDLSHTKTHSLSTLYLPSVSLNDSGNYSCQPASLQRVAITLHVLKEEKEQELSAKESVSDANMKNFCLGNVSVIVSLLLILFITGKLQNLN